MELLDIGGGFPGSNNEELKFEEITAVINPVLDKYFPADTGIKIIAEPGRFYVASACTLVVNIIAKKVIMDAESAPDEVDKKTSDKTMVYYVNDGVYGAFTSKVMHSFQFLPTLHKKPKPDQVMYLSIIRGQTCDSMDWITAQCFLPDLEVGDWLLFENIGAYTMVSTSTFNGFQKPEVHYIMSRPAWQLLQKICSHGLPALMEESHRAIKAEMD